MNNYKKMGFNIINKYKKISNKHRSYHKKMGNNQPKNNYEKDYVNHTKYLKLMKTLNIMLRSRSYSINDDLCTFIYKKDSTLSISSFINCRKSLREYKIGLSLSEFLEILNMNDEVINELINKIRTLAKKHIYRECIFGEGLTDKYDFEYKKFTPKVKYDMIKLLDNYKYKDDIKLREFIIKENLYNEYSYRLTCLSKNIVADNSTYIEFYKCIKKWILNSPYKLNTSFLSKDIDYLLIRMNIMNVMVM